MVRKVAAALFILPCIAGAVSLSPFVQGGLNDVRAGDWTFITKQEEELVPVYYGSTFIVGGGFTADIAKFRQKRIVPTLSLDTEAGVTYYRKEWETRDRLEGRTQTFFQLSVLETLVLRVKIPAGSRLVTPFIGIGGGFAVIPSSVGRLDEYVEPGEEEYYSDSVTAFSGAYAVPFGLEITLTPSSTIYWRFGVMSPVGKVTYEYQTAPRRRERVESSIPNSLLVMFGYRWGQ